MNNYFKKKKWTAIFVIIIITVLISGCDQWFNEKRAPVISFEQKEFIIDPSSILNQLDNRNTDVFILREDEFEGDIYSEISAFWDQEDYYKIAQTLHQQLWKLPLESHLYHMIFSVNCTDVDEGGFSSASFYSTRAVQVNEEGHRIDYEINIYPFDNRILTSRGEFGPTDGAAKPIELEKMKVTAEEAVRIAEENGAAEKRLEHDNRCSISVYMPGSIEKGWYVVYSSNYGEPNFYYKMEIDPQTGKIKND